MAQPEKKHIEVDLSGARRLVKRAMRDLEEANRALARAEEAVAASYGIKIERTQT